VERSTHERKSSRRSGEGRARENDASALAASRRAAI
jgi:hypothetical protein